MILIVGGAWQGKTAYVNEHYNENYKIINGYHNIVKEQLLAKKNPMEEVKQFVETVKSSSEECLEEQSFSESWENLVIISDETGCGVVPVDTFERAYREQSGRVNCYLASEADEVIRVICGIGKRIK